MITLLLFYSLICLWAMIFDVIMALYKQWGQEPNFPYYMGGMFLIRIFPVTFLTYMVLSK